jgi:hypothetical protein
MALPFLFYTCDSGVVILFGYLKNLAVLIILALLQEFIFWQSVLPVRIYKKELYFGWVGQEKPSDVISVMVWS